MFLILGFAFLAGVVTVFSPCILPLMPIILSSANGVGKQKPIGVVIGFVSSFTFFTLFLSTIVRVSGVPADSLRLVSIVVLFLFGLSMLVPVFQKKIEIFFSRFANLVPNGQKKGGIVGGIVVGAIPVAMAVASVTGKNSFAVRKEPKGHGDGALIAGPLKPGQKVLIVEDTVTTGGSLIPSIDAVQAYGCTVVAVAALLDRGGEISKICEDRDLTFVSSITAPDLGFEFGS